MIVYRIAHSLYSKDISGAGAKLFGGRWNSVGIPMLYASQHISLAVLELMVHSRLRDYYENLDLVEINIPDNIEPIEITLTKLKKNWELDAGYTRFIGDEFIRNNQSLILKVPSAVIQEEHNFIINPLHTDFKKLKINNIREFETDERLFVIK
ncbi:MAG TPA: RES family NAD+ phosphorylase [Ferruginibacter sp.]|nr:RES family NAD+ phosphorylase [Ferruginibacter sp.]HRE63910.1 RES family NAD+ phosphorylase [Ferruginibacter sp.]